MTNASTLHPIGLEEGLLKKLSQETTVAQQFWLSGYLFGLATAQETETTEPASKVLTILYGSQTGNSKKVASRAAKAAEAQGWTVQLHDLNNYPTRQLQQEKNILLVVSTQGEGEPPVSAESFYQWLMGPRAPKLTDVSFAVCALGDKSYLKYCQTGLDLDARLANLGAKRLADCVCCDVDFETDADEWYQRVLGVLTQTKSGHANTSIPAIAKSGRVQTAPVFDRHHPFEAAVLEKIQLHGRGAEKETWHFELSLEDSGLQYAPGDALGVYANNSDALVESVLNAAKLDGSKTFAWEGQSLTLAQILQSSLELSVLNRSVLQQYQGLSGHTELDHILQDAEQLKRYMWGRNVSDLLQEFPFELSEQQLIGVLRKLPPRLYSIASSLSFSPDEAHLTVAAVRYQFKDQQRKGVASGFLSDEIRVGDKLRVFVEENSYFKLPENDDTDIIMVGPGTGVAPFRAFVQERVVRGSKGKNWLFFGNPHFETDFLYQSEWLQHLKESALDRLDVAFSRDQAGKIYVQHRLLERARMVYERIENGAYFYVCGDKNRMARDVQHALLEIIQKVGGKSPELAQEYLQTLKKQRRFLEDVY